MFSLSSFPVSGIWYKRIQELTDISAVIKGTFQLPSCRCKIAQGRSRSRTADTRWPTAVFHTTIIMLQIEAGSCWELPSVLHGRHLGGPPILYQFLFLLLAKLHLPVLLSSQGLPSRIHCWECTFQWLNIALYIL